LINLIKNEFVKTYKKKGILIMLFVIAGFIILTNFLYKGMEKMELITTPKDSYTEVKKIDYDLSSKKELEQYIDDKSIVDVYKLKEKYKDDSWQYAYINEDIFYDYFYVFNSYEYNLTDKDTYDFMKLEYDEYIKYLDNDDWKGIVLAENKRINEQINFFDGNEDLIEIKQLKVDLEVNKMRLEKNIPYGYDYRNINLNIYSADKKNLLLYDYEKLSDLDKNEYNQTKQEMLIAKYNIENDIDDTNIYNNFSIFKELMSEYSLLILIFVFMVASGINSQEFNKGTIKLLLVKPYTRTQILLSKYIVSLCSIVISFIIVLILQLIIGSLILDINSLSNPVLIYNSLNDSLHIYNLFEYVFLQFVALLPQFVLLNTIVFALSTITTNTAFSIIIGFVFNLGSNIFELIVRMFDDVLKSLIYFSHWDLSPYIFNTNPIVSGCNIFISILVILIYVGIIMGITIIIFKKKDIKNI